MLKRMLATIVFFISIMLLTGSTSAQDDEGSRRSELGVRQKLVQRKMVELETKLTIIAERLKEKEPERHDRLVKAYQQSKEQLITKKMEEVSDLLDEDRLQDADDKLSEVINNLEALIRLLTNEQEDMLSAEEEERMLEEWKKNIQQQLQEQKTQKQDTQKIANKEETIKNLEAQIKQLEELIQQQQSVIENTEKNSGAGLREMDKIADQQFEVRKETEALEKELGRVGEPKNSANDQKPGDQKPGDQKPGDQKPGDQKPGDQKPGDQKPGDQKPGDQKPGDSKPGDSQQQQSPPQPGQKALEQASKHQQRAEEKLGSGKSDDAKRQEEMAKKEMDKALSEIKKEKRRIESLPPEAFAQMADKQRRTRDKALDVMEQMKKAPKPKSEESNNQNANQQKPQQPGQQAMEQAGDSMKKAADDLQDKNAEGAQKKQKKAQEDLETALKEIEERLNQLREETREEKLARLESRFREMLDRQQVASVMTVELDDKRTNLGELRRRDQLLMLRLGNEELEISEIGQQAYDLLLEDGTSIVFPEIVQELRDDLEKAAQLLQDERTDRFTQLIQKEIETTIQDLLDALKEAKNKGGGGGGGGGGGKQPLLKMSAELKILKMQQQRLNRRTKKVEQLRGQDDLEKLLDDEALEAAELQSKLLEMTEGIMEKSQK